MPQITLTVVSMWKRSADAEGNPFHKPQTRERILDQRVDVIPVEGVVVRGLSTLLRLFTAHVVSAPAIGIETDK